VCVFGEREGLIENQGVETPKPKRTCLHRRKRTNKSKPYTIRLKLESDPGLEQSTLPSGEPAARQGPSSWRP
jgi:hypothetical protein